MTQTRPALLLLALAATLAGCGTAPTKTSQNEDTPITPPFKGGGYYKDDGPGANPPANLGDVPDATPKWEPLHRFANDRYKVLGREYAPIAADKSYKVRGMASWYGRKFHGKPTSSGEPYDMYAMTAAHATLPLPSYARVTNLDNGKSVVVRVNDRGPFHDGRIIDLSYTAAYKLDILKGVTPVEVESVLPDSAPTSFSAQAEAITLPVAEPASAVAPVVPAPTAAAPVRPEASPVPGSPVIYLQLGAFSNPATAQALAARATALPSGGLPGVMQLETNGLHKVQAGPFANAAEADQAATRIQTELGIQAFKVTGERPTNPAPVAEAAVASGIYLQVGALSSPEAASALASRVKSRFGDELPGLSQITAGPLIKVRIGPFDDPAAAERLAMAYQQDFGVRPYRIAR